MLTRAILAAVALVSVAQAKPVITGSNIKSYMNSVVIKTVVIGREYVTLTFSADGIAYPNGIVYLVNPKLILNKQHLGIEADQKSAAQMKTATEIADRICGFMGRTAAKKQGVVDSVLYPSLFASLKIETVAAGGLLIYRGQVSDSKKPVLSSITCE